MNMIETEELSRDFNGRQAVDKLTFAVVEGEVFGFLGPNGAGKTTTIRMLTGQLFPTSGCARVAGYNVVDEVEKMKPQIGVVFEHQNLYDRLSARENLLFSARLYGISRSRVEEMLEQVGLRERAGDRVQRFSNGMRQRLVIARALLHRPKVLFLDEPTRGLDPSMSREIRRLVTSLASQGVTVFLTTHYMEEADELCGRVAFLCDGRIVALDRPERLKVAYGQRAVKVLLEDGGSLQLNLQDENSGKELDGLIAAGRALTVHSCEASLEEVFIRLTGRRLE